VAETPHFAFPFERGPNGKVNTVEQGDPEHIMSRANVVVRCPQGFRYERPEFGIPWPEYHQRIDLGAIRSALAEHDIDVSAIRDILVNEDPSTHEITIEVTV